MRRLIRWLVYPAAVGLLVYQAACAPLVAETPDPTAAAVQPFPLLTNTPTVQLPTNTPAVPLPATAISSATFASPSGPQRIQFAPGSTSVTVSGQLAPSGSNQYILYAQAGQTMTIDLAFTQGQAILVVWGADGNVLLSDHAEASHFQMNLPKTQDYNIQVKGSPTESTAFQMTVNIPAASLPVTNVPATSTGSQRIQFPAGATSVTVSGQLAASDSDQYVLSAFAGQTMSINLAFSEGQAILVVWGADGDVLLSDHAEASSFQRVLPKTQDYNITVHGRPDGNTSYSMTITIPPLP